MHVAIRPKYIAFLWVLLVALGTTACSTDPAPTNPAPTEPRCEPRSTTEPGRLNVDSAAEGFGGMTPCRATLQFAIARNTDLRGLQGAVSVESADGEPLASAPLSVELVGPDGGMYRAEQLLEPVPEHICRQLSFELQLETCTGDDGQPLACPDVAVRPSQVLRTLEVTGPGLSICYDN